MVGRPTTYNPDYCEQVGKFLAEGYSLGAFAGSIGVARSTVYKWAEEHPEFSDAVKTGQAGSQFWWEKRNREFAATGEGNATAIIFGLKNRAADDWRDKQELEHTGQLTVNVNKPV
jgi:hypothetical protein